MKLPRDLSGKDLAQALRSVGYRVTRQTGSHMRLTTLEGGEHHITVPQLILYALARWLGFSQTLRNISNGVVKC